MKNNKSRRTYFARFLAVALSVFALIGTTTVPAHAIAVMFSANIGIQTAYAGESIRPVWFVVTVRDNKTVPSFSLSTNLPNSTLLSKSTSIKGIEASLPHDVTPGIYTIKARIVVDKEIRYATSTVRVLSKRDHANPQIFEGQARNISAGNYQTCIVSDSKTVKCWGRNTSGQVGQSPEKKVVPTPRTVRGLSNIVKVSTGNAFSCALRGDGNVFCWGDNTEYQLGQDTISQSYTPVKVQGLPSRIVDIKSGSAHSCALASTGEAYCWGSTLKGQLGNGTAGFPLKQAVRVTGGHNWKSIDAGGFHTCGITTDGDAYCWGQNNLHQLGSIQTTAYNAANPIPKKVDTQTKYLSVHTGYDFTCAIKTNRTVDCWGSNSKGQIGAGLEVSPKSEANKPVQVNYLSDVYQLDTGYYHACSLDGNGITKCWGDAKYSKLGNIGTINRSYPVDAKIGHTDGYPAYVALGASHSCFLSFDGGVRCWGNQANGQLGDNTQYEETSTKQFYSALPVEPKW